MFLKVNNNVIPHANMMVNQGQAEISFYSDDMTLNQVEQQFLDQDLVIEHYNDEEILVGKYYSHSLLSIKYEKEIHTGRWLFIITLGVSTIDIETFETLSQQINNTDEALAELGEIVSYYEEIIGNMQHNYDELNTTITDLTQRIAVLEG